MDREIVYRQERQRYIEGDMDRLLFIETERYRKVYSEGLYSLEDVRAFALTFSLIERREKTNQRKRKKRKRLRLVCFLFYVLRSANQEHKTTY